MFLVMQIVSVLSFSPITSLIHCLPLKSKAIDVCDCGLMLFILYYNWVPKMSWVNSLVDIYSPKDIAGDSYPSLNAVLHPKNFEPLMCKQLIEWNQNLSPSFNIVRNMIDRFVTQNSFQNIPLFVLDLPKRIPILHSAKCPKNFLRACLAVIKAHRDEFSPHINYQQAREEWQNIHFELLQAYMDTYNIKLTINHEVKQSAMQGDLTLPTEFQIPFQKITSSVYSSIQANDFQQAANIIKLSGQHRTHIDLLVSQMLQKNQSSKAMQYLNLFKVNPSEYSQLGQKISKKAVRYFLAKHGWQHCEDIFSSCQKQLAVLVQDLAKKKQWNIARSILKRNPRIEDYFKSNTANKQTNQLQVGEERQEVLFSLTKENNWEYIQNFLFRDSFSPSDTQKYFSLPLSFHINQEDVIWVADSKSSSLEMLINDLQNTSIIALDTESSIARNEVQGKPTTNRASVVQLAFNSKVYVIDGLKCQSCQLKHAIFKYLDRNGRIIGHAVDDDFKLILNSLNCSEIEKSLVKRDNVIDMRKLFKNVGVLPAGSKQNSLAVMVKQMLGGGSDCRKENLNEEGHVNLNKDNEGSLNKGKQICKEQTMTNWTRRPLRKNQLHYAAMDAFIVLKLYQVMQDKFGENIMHFYCSYESQM